ncbi:MAG: hypothetical protein ACR2IS_16485 [Nitrososphaeraceae archaeon]
MMNNDIEEKNSVDSTNENGDNEDSRVKQRDSARTKDTSVVDITKSDNISRDILDITETPDVAIWNKSVQNKSNVANMVKHSKERENGEAQAIGVGLRKIRRNYDDNKDSTIIDPTNQREMNDVVNSGDTLTDKA